MSISTDQKGNFMVVGSSGSGKTTFCSQMVSALLSGQRFESGGKRIGKNNNDSGERHENQG